MSNSEVLRFGVIADPQYADADSHAGRDYRASLGKLAEAIDTLNAEPLDFVVTLGDMIDQGWENYDAALVAYAGLRHPHRYVLGNHDFKVSAEFLSMVPQRLGMATRHYDFAIAGIRFVALDQTEISLFANQEGSPGYCAAQEALDRFEQAKAPNAKPWNAGMSAKQKAWLDAILQRAADARERVVVFGHYPLDPFNDHALWDADDLRDRIAAAPQAMLYLAGHHHVGGYHSAGSTHFVTVEGMVETSDTSAFAVVEIYETKIEITGYGRATSRTLSI